MIDTALIYYEEEVHAWEIAYNLGRIYWGHGYATEAMRLILDFAQTELGIFEVVGRYVKENPDSGNIMKPFCFLKEQTENKNFLISKPIIHIDIVGKRW